MLRIIFSILLLILLSFGILSAQNYTFNFNINGSRVCLAECEVDLITPAVTVKLLDASSNSSLSSDIFRRYLYGTGSDWVLVAEGLPAGTSEWIDYNVSQGDVWEYKIKRNDTWTYASQTYDAVGYTVGSLLKDNSDYQGQMILLVANNIVDALPEKCNRLKKELTADGWFVNEIIVDKAESWYSGDTILGIKSQINAIYNSAPENDKPKVLFILGHVPMPRSGSTFVTAPDGHDQNKGARGFDGFYADIDGIYTDTATFNPGGLQTDFAINIPGDFKWDQDFFVSDIEMAFGRVDLTDIDDYDLTEIELTERYLDKLSNYKNVSAGFEMGEKTAFYFGYNNSNDGTFRTLPNISKSENVYQNTAGATHPQWVQENGPFKIYMQNQQAPDILQWDTYGMNATVFTSDQSYYGYNDVPQNNYVYSRIRALIGSDTKCIVSLWTTTGVNNFYQACVGDAFGLGIKEMMNHNAINNNIEKAPQEWDSQDWWNRTHFAYIGDPTVRLFQVKPATNLVINNIENQAVLSWSSSEDADIAGYHVYKSDEELGIYTRISTNLIAENSFIDAEYEQFDWYMVKPVKIMESGCGKFLQPGLGIFAQGNFLISGKTSLSHKSINIYPNPATSLINVNSEASIVSVEIYTPEGKSVVNYKSSPQKSVQINLSGLNAGIYFINIETLEDSIVKKLIVK